jgi:hypothetical protein
VTDSLHADELVCPHCQAELERGAPQCWLCEATLGEPAQKSQPTSRPSQSAGFSYSLSTMLLATTLVAICFGLLSIAPGLGIPICILLAPVLVRTVMVVRRREAAGRKVSTSEKAWLIFGSLVVANVILAVVTVAAVGTFCAVCLSAGNERAIPVAILIAAGVTIPLLVVLFKWVRTRYRRDIAKGSDES